MTRAPSVIFFVLCLLYGAVNACTNEMDCTACHECIRGVCVPVEEGTDPVGECPVLCDVKLVCSRKQVCVYKEAPACNCNWISGLCMIDPTTVTVESMTTTTTTTLILSEELQRLGYSDADIQMLIELFQNEMEYHHRIPTLPLPIENEQELQDYEELMHLLNIIQEVVPIITLLFLICGILYFRRNMTAPSSSMPIKKNS